MLEDGNDIGEKLSPKKESKNNLKFYIIIGASVLVVAIIVVLVILLKKSDDKDDLNFSTIPLPEDIIIDDAHYLFNGNIFICYKRNNTLDYTYFGVISDDGSNFKELYGDKLVISEKANGIRLIPFLR